MKLLYLKRVTRVHTATENFVNLWFRSQNCLTIMHYLDNLSPVMFFSGKFSVLFFDGRGGCRAEFAILLLQASLSILLFLLHNLSIKENIATGKNLHAMSFFFSGQI